MKTTATATEAAAIAFTLMFTSRYGWMIMGYDADNTPVMQRVNGRLAEDDLLAVTEWAALILGRQGITVGEWETIGLGVMGVIIHGTAA